MNRLTRSHRSIKTLLASAGIASLLAFPAVIADDKADETILLWGDTHLHTSRSFDAFAAGNVAVTPDVAYRFAKGYPVLDPKSGTRVQLDQPLDFLVIADHVELMDIMPMLINEDPRLVGTETGRKLSDLIKGGKGGEAYLLISGAAAGEDRDLLKALTSEAIRKDSWAEVVEAAEKHNAPG